MELKARPALSFEEALTHAADNLLSFKGRARRSEYWWTELTVIAGNIILTPFLGFVLVLLAIPLTVRRLHDTGRSGWWYALLLILRTVVYVPLALAYISLIFALVSYDGSCPSPLTFLPMTGHLLLFLLMAGTIVVLETIILAFTCLDSDKEGNKYGPSPKYYAAEEGEPASTANPGSANTTGQPKDNIG